MLVCSAYCQISPAVIGLPTFSRTCLASSKNEIFLATASVMMTSFAVGSSWGANKLFYTFQLPILARRCGAVKQNAVLFFDDSARLALPEQIRKPFKYRHLQ